jgi:hypothetical protein
MDSLNPNLVSLVFHAGLLLFLVFSVFKLGIRYGYNKRYHEVKKETKLHQWLLIFFLVGCTFGYYFSYYMLSKSVAYKVDEAYELGFQWGQQTEINKNK